MPPSVPKPDEAAVPLDPAARQGDEDAGPAQDVGTKDAPTPTSALYTVVQTLPMLVLAVVGLLLSGRELDRMSVGGQATHPALDCVSRSGQVYDPCAHHDESERKSGAKFIVAHVYGGTCTS